MQSTSDAIKKSSSNKWNSYFDYNGLSEFIDDFDDDDQNIDVFTLGKSLKIDLHDMDYSNWKREIDHDILQIQ